MNESKQIYLSCLTYSFLRLLLDRIFEKYDVVLILKLYVKFVEAVLILKLYVKLLKLF